MGGIVDFIEKLILKLIGTPGKVRRFLDRAFPWVAGVFVITLAVGLVGVIIAPPDHQQNESVMIMYIHVPSAWMSLLGYSALALFCIAGLVSGAPVAHMFARAIAPVGAAFTALTLITGALWGKPTWGAWWVWDDPRLNSELVLLFFYLGYIALVNAFDDQRRGQNAGAILGIVGFINVPIVHYSVQFLASQHQGSSVFRADGPTIYASMLWPLLVMAVAALSYFILVVILRMRTKFSEARLNALRARTAGTGGGGE